MKNSKTRVMFIMCIAMAIMAIGYAYFATNLDITATGNITTNWKVNFISITSGNNGGTGGSNAATPTFTDTTATMSANLQVPGDYMEYDLVLKNSGSINAIIESINAEATGSPAIIFSISGINEGDKLTGGSSKTIKIKIEYDVNVTSQPSETTKTLTVSIKAVQDTGQTITNQSPSINQSTYLSSSILRDNVAQADTNIDFRKASSDTNGKGLYYTSTNTEDNKTTYYFRGDVKNNYVKFGTATRETCMYNGKDVAKWHGDGILRFRLSSEECTAQKICLIGDKPILFDSFDGEYGSCEEMVEWIYSDYFDSNAEVVDTGEKAEYNEVVEDLIWRIVRINEDGSIRLIAKDAIKNIIYNEDSSVYFDNAGVGYMYGTTGQGGDNAYKLTHENNTPSTVKTYLDNWYNTNFKTSFSRYIADAGFCNDRSIAPSAGLWNSSDTALGYGENKTYYGAYNRLENLHKPQFACPNEENDLFTTKNSTKGNKALEYPIGLITADETAYAGSSTSYLLDKEFHLSMSWTMTPSQTNMMYLSNGAAEYMDNEGFTVKPVINLRSDVEVSTDLPDGCTKLDGTEACPYIIKTN